EDYSPTLKNNSKICYHIGEGKVHVEVANQAKYDDVDLVVCCTHGASGFEESYIGSNAYRIVMYGTCPIITVRPNYRFRLPSNIIVMPIDSSRDTRQKVTFTSKFARLLGAEIHVLGLHSSSLSSIRRKVNSYVAQIQEFLYAEGVNHKTIIKEVDNITKATVAYAESVDADLISIMTEQESSTWSFFLGTYAQQMITSSDIPVLSITPKLLVKESFTQT
ncbi:MAG: universal stress protein, partial [Bacteroidales bacterium]|nr:universal stress protein [Bacteroidales bacterium]